MSISISLPTANLSLFFYDCEVDHIDKDRTNMTEVCVSNASDNRKFVGYMKKSEHALWDGPYQKPIPSDMERRSSKTILERMIRYVKRNTQADGTSILMGYNVKGWDEPVLKANCERFKVLEPFGRWKFFDLAKVAHHLGFPMGTTQQQLEKPLRLDPKKLPANRHRAQADAKVVKEIWKKMTEKIAQNQEALNRINAAFLEENGEELVANLLKEYDPTLIPSEAAKERILKTKAAEKMLRKEIVVLFDLESTGLFNEMNSSNAASYNVAPRIVEFAAKVLSPYKEEGYQNEVFTSLVDSGIPIPAAATEVHGIATGDLVGKPSMSEVWEQFEAWIKTTNTFRRIMLENPGIEEPRIILVGYNSGRYDNVLLEQELLPETDLKREFNTKVKGTWDAMTLASTWYTGKTKRPENNTMQAHRTFLEIPENQAHRALGDVQVLEQILYKICDPVDPSALILEAIQLNRPGVGAKEVILEAQCLMAAQEAPDIALKHAVRSYQEKVRQEEAKETRSVKRRKLNEAPDTSNSQSHVILSLDPDAYLLQGLEGDQKIRYI